MTSQTTQPTIGTTATRPAVSKRRAAAAAIGCLAVFAMILSALSASGAWANAVSGQRCPVPGRPR